MIPEDKRASLINDGIHFLRAVTDCYGAEEGMRLWDRIASELDPKLKGEIFFAILCGSQGNRINLSVANLTDGLNSKIMMIKTLRTVTGMGLKEAKDIVDLLLIGHSETITINVDRNQAIRELRSAGFRA